MQSQPTIDLKGILTEADEKWRLCVTIPWIVQYLSMLDYTSLRTKYYQSLLEMLFEIYTHKLKRHSDNAIKSGTVIFLKLTLGWLFDLPHFPQDLFYELPESKMASKMAATMADEESLDSLELIDDSIVFEACPFLRDINVLLVTSKPSNDVKDAGSFRHITPVTMTLNAEDRMRNKEKEIQVRIFDHHQRQYVVFFHLIGFSLVFLTLLGWGRVLDYTKTETHSHCIQC